MSIEETELTFIRCPQCRSLVPAIATRCRMCGHDFDKANVGAATSEPAEDSFAPSAPDASTPSDVAPMPADPPSPASAGAPVEPIGAPNPFEADVSIAELSVAESRAAESRAGESRPGEPSSSGHSGSIAELAAEMPASQQEPVAPEFARTPMNGEASRARGDNTEQFDDSSDDGEDRPEKKKRRRRRRKKKTTQGDNMDFNQDLADRASDDGDDFEEEAEVYAESSPAAPAPRDSRRSREEEGPRASSGRGRADSRRERDAEPQGRRREAPKRRAPKRDSELIGWMVTFHEDEKGLAHEIRAGRYFITGQRLKDSDMVLEDDSLSTPHLLVKAAPGAGLKVQDLMSENGSYVKRTGESEYQSQSDAIQLEHGDWIKLGNFEAMICLVPYPPAEASEKKKASKA